MGIKVEDFLYDYFSLEQLKDVLYDIGFPVGKNKQMLMVVGTGTAVITRARK